MLSAAPPNRKGTNERPSSASSSAVITAFMPMPPYSCGVCTPQKPASRAFACNDASSVRVSPGSPARSRRRTSASSGMISRRTNVRTQSRTSFSSVLSVKSMNRLRKPNSVRL